MRTPQLGVSLLVIGLLGLSDCYKVLVLFPFPGRSHSILGRGFVNILLKDGNEITYVTPFVMDNPSENLTQVDVSSILKGLPPMNIGNLIDKESDLADPNILLTLMQGVAKEAILHDNVQALLNDTTKHFDVVIAEWMFSELYAGFANVFSCPLIWSSSTDPHWMVLELIGHHVSPAVVPDHMAKTLPPYSLLERLEVLWVMLRTKFIKYTKYTPIDSQLYQQAFSTAAEARGVKLLPFEEMRRNASLVLGNSHIASGQVMSLPPSYIPIGGYFIYGAEEALSPELQSIMDSSTNGVIYFSMGSVLKSKDIPEEMKRDLLEVFSKLKQTVLWKMEENLSDLPKNVHTIQWAPQRSILKHSNTVLFITHGGLLSTTEALHYGVPLIGIPAFADQFQNIAKAVHKGFAVQVPLTRGLATDLKVAIRKILNDVKYIETARFLSWVFKSGYNSADALSRAVRLVVEGPTLLRPPELPLYEVFCLDVAAMISACCLVVVWGLRVLLRRLKQSSVEKQKTL